MTDSGMGDNDDHVMMMEHKTIDLNQQKAIVWSIRDSDAMKYGPVNHTGKLIDMQMTATEFGTLTHIWVFEPDPNRMEDLRNRMTFMCTPPRPILYVPHDLLSVKKKELPDVREELVIMDE